jgi:hypothetical protein
MPSFDLSTSDPARLRAAVLALLSSSDGAASVRLPASGALKHGAEAIVRGTDDPVGALFVSLLEVGYLVASTDGFPDAERDALAALLEHATGRAIDHAAMRLHFEDLDAQVAFLGRRERMLRAAADFEGAARDEALGFAAVVALADGKLGEPEVAALVDLGTHMAMSEQDVLVKLGAVVAAAEKALGAPGAGGAA